jgi:acetyl-CoA carboxylase carboxyl transferase subunit beta
MDAFAIAGLQDHAASRYQSPDMAWWSRTGGLQQQDEPKKSVPKGIWTKCDKCAATLYGPELGENAGVCMHCGHHLRLPTEARIALMLDPDSFTERDRGLEASDPLGFRVDGKRYRDQLKATIKKVGDSDAYRGGSATIGGFPVEVGFFVFEFMGGSMGSVVGEKITRQFERAIERRVPAVVFSASGGARMQEGVLSLMQMAKTSAARSKMRRGRRCGRPRSPTSPCCSTRPPAASPPRWRCSAT